MLKMKDYVKKILRYINSRHCNFKFIREGEKDNKISFLDMSISRNNKATETSIFRKATFCGVYINFNNFLLTKYRRSLLHTLHRTNNICSSYIQLREEMRLEYVDFNGQ